MKSLLGSAIGTCLAEGDGLKVAYLPLGVSEDIAVEIVRTANNIRPTDPSSAVLVTDGDDDYSDPKCPRLTASSVIGWRHDDRLVVIYGQPPETASFLGSVDPVLPATFPVQTKPQLTVSKLAVAALDSVLAECGAQIGIMLDKSSIHMVIEKSLLLTQSIHREFGQTLKSWNANWYNSVDLALRTLCVYLENAAESGSSRNAEQIIDSVVYACFGLPALGSDPKRRYLAKDFYDSWMMYWATEETIAATAEHLSYRLDATRAIRHPVEFANWATFDMKVAVHDNHLVALVELCNEDINFVEAIASLAASEFLNPYGGSNSVARMKVCGSRGEVLSVEDKDDAICFLQSELVHKNGDWLLETEEVRVYLPLTAPVSAPLIAASKADLRLPGANVVWSGSIASDQDGAAFMVGRFQLRFAKSNPRYSLPIKRIAVQIPPQDPLQIYMDPNKSVQICVLPAGRPAIIVARQTKNGLRDFLHAGPKDLDVAEGCLVGQSAYDLDLPNAYSTFTVLAANVNDSAMQNGGEMEKVDLRERLFLGTLRPSGSDTFVLDGERFEVAVAEAVTRFESPLEAAIYCERVSSIYPAPELLDSALGTFEAEFSRIFELGNWKESLGHFAMPADRDAPISSLRFNPAFGMFSDESINSVLTPKFEVPQELLNSKELSQFVAATAALGIDTRLSPIEEGDSRILPSKVSWRHLFGDDERKGLEDYLEAYCSLIGKARALRNPYGLFWAAYPFSVSVWTTRQSFDCSAVLLSPLHPLRLAWLAGAEATLWDSRLAAALAGTVEGWNFPIVGPRNTPSGRMIAVPIDAGAGSLFLGWSMLVPASLDTPHPLGAPSKIGNLSAPGSAVSGLNGTAAMSALRSYMRLNPHVTTLTVDLAASANASRLSEIDSAVLTAAGEWTSKDEASLAGGIRVFDSSHRKGERSEIDVLKFGRRVHGTPLVWKRYLPDPAAPIQCSVRILQDSGSTVSFGHGNGVNRGISGNIPLRRFEVQTDLQAGGFSSDARPALKDDDGWLPFSHALSAVENSAEVPEIQSFLSNALQASNGAEWTISGEAFLNPSVMAKLVDQATGGSQMLWEWRPPFLDSLSQAPSLQRRPFVSITRVPTGFRDGVAQLIGKALGREPQDSEATKVLSKLGSRGVGLSTLFAMGETHASGALGFYLTFKLTEQLAGLDWNFFVLPMDASDGFLRALAGGSWRTNEMQRADLLVLAVNDEEVVLVPVEIKCYKLLSEQPTPWLPRPEGGLLDEPIKQVMSSVDLLSGISRQWQTLRMLPDNADRHLWLNGLSAVIDAAMRLHPFPNADEHHLHRRLRRLLDGKMSLRSGKPLVTYFQHGAQTPDGAMFDNFRLNRDESQVGVLVANTGYAYTSLDSPDSDLAQEWCGLVSWALEGDLDHPSSSLDETTLRAHASDPIPDPVAHHAANSPQSAATEENSPLKSLVPEAAAESASEEPSSLPIVGPTDGIRLRVGDYKDTVGIVPAEFWPSNTRLNQMNVGVVGDLGTGKTQLLQSLVHQMRKSAQLNQARPLSFLIIDYKEDFQKEQFLSRVGGRVLKPLRIPLNIFALPGEYSVQAAYKRATEFFDVISKIYSGVGPVQRFNLVNVIVRLFEEAGGVAPTLGQVLAGYQEATDKPDSLNAILSDFVYGGIFSETREELRTFSELIEDSVLVLALKDLGTNQKTKNALVILFLNMYFDYMLQSTKPDFLPGKSTKQVRQLNSFLLVDEATNIMAYDFPVLEQILLQGREFGFGTILSSQFLKHFTAADTNYGEPLLTWFLHKVPQVSLKELQVLGLHDLPASTPGRIAAQTIHEAFYVSLDVPGRFIRGLPFHELMTLEGHGSPSEMLSESPPSTATEARDR